MNKKLYKQAREEYLSNYIFRNLKDESLMQIISKVLDEYQDIIVGIKDLYNKKVDEQNKDLVVNVKTYMERDPNGGSYEWYKKNIIPFEESYYDKGLFFGGYWSDTNQRAVSVKFDQNKPFEEQLGILEFIPYIKANEKNIKKIRIFESSLSEGGAYSIEYDDSKKLAIYEIVKTSWGTNKTLETFHNLEACLKYVYDNHPYEWHNDKQFDEE